MRHRRGEFNDGGNVYGGKVKGNGSKHWNQNRLSTNYLPRGRENYLPRNRENYLPRNRQTNLPRDRDSYLPRDSFPSFNEHIERYSTDTRYTERSSGFDHVIGRETASSDNRCSGVDASVDSYSKKNYDTSVNITSCNDRCRRVGTSVDSYSNKKYDTSVNIRSYNDLCPRVDASSDSYSNRFYPSVSAASCNDRCPNVDTSLDSFSNKNYDTLVNSTYNDRCPRLDASVNSCSDKNFDTSLNTASYNDRCSSVTRLDESVYSYSNKNYDTSVNILHKQKCEANIEHPYGHWNKQNALEKINNRISDQSSNILANVNKVTYNHLRQPISHNSDVVKKSTAQTRYVKDFVPRNYSEINTFPIQSSFRYGEVPYPREQETSHVFKERQSRSLSDYEPYGKANTNWKTDMASKYWDSKGQNSELLRKNRMNVNSVPKYNFSETFSYHPHMIDTYRLTQSTDDLGGSQNPDDSIFLNGPNMIQPKMDKSFEFERSFHHLNKSSSGNDKFSLYPTQQHDPAYFGRFAHFPLQGEQKQKEYQQPFPKNNLGISPSNNMSEKSLNPFQGRTLLSENMHSYRQPYLQQNHSLKDFSNDCHSYDDSYTRMYEPIKSISQVITRSRTPQPIQLNIDTNIHVPQIQASIIQDVSMIPLPPSPPPPHHSQENGSVIDRSNHTPSTKVKNTNESQSRCLSDTSVNVVSSTSVELDENPPLNEQNLTQRSKTTSTLLEEDRKMKEKPTVSKLSEAKDFQDSTNDDIKCSNFHVEEQCNERNITDNFPVERSGQSKNHDHKSDSDNQDGHKNDASSETPVSISIGNNNGDKSNTHDKEAIISFENEKSLNVNRNEKQHHTNKDAYGYQYKKMTSSNDKQSMGQYENHQKNDRYPSNFKEPLKTKRNFHRPWQLDLQVDRHTFDRNKSRHRYYSSYQPFRKQRPYDRTLSEKQGLSGLGIHTYPFHEGNQGNKNLNSSLDYFRPWERYKNIKRDKTDLNKPICASFFRTDLFPVSQNKEFYINPTERTNCDGKTLTNKNLNNVRMVTQVHDLTKDEDSSHDRKQEKNIALNCDSKNDDTEKIVELCSGSKSDSVSHQEENNNTTTGETTTSSTDDLFTKKREERYNKGHLYSEIIALNSRHDKGKKVKDESNVDGKKCIKVITSVNTKAVKTPRCLDLKNKIFGPSKSFKHLTTPSTVAMPILSILESSISKVTSKGLSKIAKPDISLENKLLKTGFSISETKLGVYKIPLLSRSEENSDVGKKERFNTSTSEENVDEFNNTTMNKKNKINTLSSSKTKSKIMDKKKCKKSEKSIHEILKKPKLKSGKESKTSVSIKSLHPKLRHKIESLREDSKENENTCSIVMKKDNIDLRSDDTVEIVSARNKNSVSLAEDKNTEVKSMKNITSQLARGKFVLCTPNTFKVKETKKSKTKEKRSESVINESDISAKENLDKALFSAKKHLLYRALAIDALTRGKTRPLVEKKSNQRKSLITKDISKEELTQLKEMHVDEQEKPAVDKDEQSTGKDNNNNDIDMIQDPKGVSQNAFNFDSPLTEYRPQRTVIGDYATQCLLGPIVSSTYYKAPGKARVIRNSKETFTGYIKCQADLSRNDNKDLNLKRNNDFNSSGMDDCGNEEKSLMQNGSLLVATPLIDVVPVGCDMSSSGLQNLSEKLNCIDTNNNNVKVESAPTLADHHKRHVQTMSASNDTVPGLEFEIGSKQKIDYACVDQTNVVASRENYFEQQQPIACQTFTSFVSHSSDSYCTPTQLEMHTKYLLAKKEIEDSSKPCYNVSSASASSPTTFLPTYEVSALVTATNPRGYMFPVCSSTPIHESDTGIISALTFDLEHKSPENSIANTSSNSELQYETSNEEFEMYRNYQLNRVVAYSDSDVQRSPYFEIDRFDERKEKDVDVSPHDTEQIRNDNYCNVEKNDNDKICFLESSYADTSSSIPVIDNVVENSAGNCESLNFEDNTSTKSVFHCPDGKYNLPEKTCGMINVDEDLQSASKDMFEDLVTDILTDVDLLSSIPISAPDIINANTNKSVEFQDSSTGSNLLQISTPENEILSPKTPCKQVQNDSNFNGTDNKMDSYTFFKSARAPTHLGKSRKPRFEKRFPKPLPRAKPQKSINAERMLYEAAERFLGDFDHNNKRSCCKVNSESKINLVSENVESSKDDKSQKQGKKAIEKEKRQDNICSDVTNDQMKHLEKPSNVSNFSTKKMSMPLKSIDSEMPAVAHQQLAMKKLILKSKGQMLKRKSHVHEYVKSASKKRHSLSKKVCRSKERTLRENRIPCIRLKTIKKLTRKGNVTVEKWKKVKASSCSKDEIDQTKEKHQDCTTKTDLRKKDKDAIRKEEKNLPKLSRHEKSVAQKRLNINCEHDKKNKDKSVQHSNQSPKTLNFSNKKYNDKYVDSSNAMAENKGKVKIDNEPKKNKTVLSVARLPNTSNMKVSKSDSMDRKVKDIISKQTCTLCSFSSSNIHEMKFHYSRKHVNWCVRCKIQFDNKDSCRYHISQSHNAEVWCDVCGSTFRNKSKLDRHLQSQFHRANKKFADLIEEKKKRKATIAVSDDDDDDDNAVQIVGISKNVYSTKKIEVTASDKYKKIKTNSEKSPTVNVDLKKETSSEYVEISEDDGDAKKMGPSVTYCKVCNQYYKKISAHLKTKKHDDMLKEKLNKLNPDDGVFAITDSDMENVSLNMEDDFQDDDDLEIRDNMSHSSDRSVVIVSDHDGNFEYESDECKAVQSEEDGLHYMKHGSGLQAKHTSQIKQEVDKEQGTQNVCQIVDNNVSLKGVNGNRNGRNADVPTVVSAFRKEMCSPTLLVRNIAADLKGKDGHFDKKLSFLTSAKQRHSKVSDGKLGNKGNKSFKENAKGSDFEEKKKTVETVLSQVKESNEEGIMDYTIAEEVYTDSDIFEDDYDDIESFTCMSNISDYEVTENPSYHDDVSMDQD